MKSFKKSTGEWNSSNVGKKEWPNANRVSVKWYRELNKSLVLNSSEVKVQSIINTLTRRGKRRQLSRQSQLIIERSEKIWSHTVCGMRRLLDEVKKTLGKRERLMVMSTRMDRWATEINPSCWRRLNQEKLSQKFNWLIGKRITAKMLEKCTCQEQWVAIDLPHRRVLPQYRTSILSWRQRINHQSLEAIQNRTTMVSQKLIDLHAQQNSKINSEV